MSGETDPGIAADNAKYDALRQEMEEAGVVQPREPARPEPEAYDADRHGGPPESLPEYDPEVASDVEVPDINEDPVAHFQARFDALEQRQQAGGQSGEAALFLENMRQHASAFEAEVPDARDAFDHLRSHRVAEIKQQFPDNQATARLAHQYGLRSPAELRNAILDRDIMSSIDHAAQLGMNPAEYFFRLSVERGYKSPTKMTTTNKKALMGALTDKQTDGDAFDVLWEKARRAGLLGS